MFKGKSKHNLFVPKSDATIADLSETPYTHKVLDGVTVLNPSLHSTDQRPIDGLVGHFTPQGAWVEGLLVAAVREAARETSGLASKSPNLEPWIVIDGAMHSSWLTAISDLLVDKGVLRLPSFESVIVPHPLRLLLESDSLQHACPAIVARCAIVVVSDCEPAPDELVLAWISEKEEKGMHPDAVKRLRVMVGVLANAALEGTQDGHEKRLGVPAHGLTGVPQVCLTQA